MEEEKLKQLKQQLNSVDKVRFNSLQSKHASKSMYSLDYHDYQFSSMIRFRLNAFPRTQCPRCEEKEELSLEHMHNCPKKAWPMQQRHNRIVEKIARAHTLHCRYAKIEPKPYDSERASPDISVWAGNNHFLEDVTIQATTLCYIS
jgi:hypothetical protein